MFEVLIVGGDDSPCLALPELLQHRLSDSSAYLRLCTCAEFVNQQQRPFVGGLNHLLHIEKVGGVGREVILNALLVADVYHDGVEDTHRAVLLHRYAEATLHHVLQQTDRLKTNRFTAGIRAGDNEQMAVGDILRTFVLRFLTS